MEKRQHFRMEILFEESGTELSAFATFLHNQLPVDLRRFFEVVEKVFFEGLFYESANGKSIKMCPVQKFHNSIKV